MASRDLRIRLLLLGLVLSAGGCGAGGEPRSDVHGEVVYDGQPLQAGMVSFEPMEGAAPPVGLAIRNGTYEARAKAGLKPGKYRVRITAPDLSKVNPNAAKDPQAPVVFVPLLPATWNVQSQLLAELKPGQNLLHFRGRKGEEPKLGTGQ